jgi:hypothetical protein
VVLVTCKTFTRKVKVRSRHHKLKTKTKSFQRCTARPVTGTVTFTVAGHMARATLARGGRVVASGVVGVAGDATTGYVRLRARLRPARYVLTLTWGGKVTSRRAVVMS